MKAVFTQHLATFPVSFWDTSPNNRKVLFKGHEMTLYNYSVMGIKYSLL